MGGGRRGWRRLHILDILGSACPREKREFSGADSVEVIKDDLCDYFIMMEIGEISGFIFPLFRHYKVSLSALTICFCQRTNPQLSDSCLSITSVWRIINGNSRIVYIVFRSRSSLQSFGSPPTGALIALHTCVVHERKEKWNGMLSMIFKELRFFPFTRRLIPNYVLPLPYFLLLFLSTDDYVRMLLRHNQKHFVGS